jgi:hypothetical protein
MCSSTLVSPGRAAAETSSILNDGAVVFTAADWARLGS